MPTTTLSSRLRRLGAPLFFAKTLLAALSLAAAVPALAAPPDSLTLSVETLARSGSEYAYVGTISGTDPDEGDFLTFSLVAGEGDEANAAFEVFWDNLYCTALDELLPGPHAIRLQAEDSHGEVYSQSIVLTVTGRGPSAGTTDFETDSIYATSGSESYSYWGDIYETGWDVRASSNYAPELATEEGKGVGGSDSIALSAFLGSLDEVVWSSNDGSEFELESVAINANGVATTLTIEPYRDGSLVAGGSVSVDTTEWASDAATAITISGEAFREIDAFRVTSSVAIEYLYFDDLTIKAVTQPVAPTGIEASVSAFYHSQSASEAVAVLTAVDADGASHSFALVSGEGDEDNGKFEIVDGELRFLQDPKTHAAGAMSARIRATDSDGLAFEAALALQLTDDLAPVLSPGSVAFSATTVANGESVSLTYPQTAADPLASVQVDFSSLGVAELVNAVLEDGFWVARAEVSGSAGTALPALLRLVDEAGNGSEFAAASQTLELVNTPPSDIQLSNTAVVRQGMGRQWVGELSAVDAEPSNEHVFRLAAGEGAGHNHLFAIESGQLHLLDDGLLPEGSYRVRLEADDGGATLQKAFVVTLGFQEAETSVAWYDEIVQSPREIGSDEGVAVYANAFGKGWDIEAIGDGRIVFEQAPYAFSVRFAEGAGSTEVRLRTSQSALFDLRALLFGYSVEAGAVTIAGYRKGELVEGSSVTQTHGTLEVPEGSDTFRYLDEVRLSFAAPADSVLLLGLGATAIHVGPVDLKLSADAVYRFGRENQLIGTVAAKFAGDESELQYALVEGRGDEGNELVTLLSDGRLYAKEEEAFVAAQYSIRVRASDASGRTKEALLNLFPEDPSVALHYPARTRRDDAMDRWRFWKTLEHLDFEDRPSFRLEQPGAGLASAAFASGAGDRDNGLFTFFAFDNQVYVYPSNGYDTRPGTYRVRMAFTLDTGKTFEAAKTMKILSHDRRASLGSASTSMVILDEGQRTAIPDFGNIGFDVMVAHSENELGAIVTNNNNALIEAIRMDDTFTTTEMSMRTATPGVFDLEAMEISLERSITVTLAGYLNGRPTGDKAVSPALDPSGADDRTASRSLEFSNEANAGFEAVDEIRMQFDKGTGWLSIKSVDVQFRDPSTNGGPTSFGLDNDLYWKTGDGTGLVGRIVSNDPEGDPMRYRVESVNGDTASSAFEVVEDTLFVVDPAAIELGEQAIRLVASDPYGAQVERTVVVSVEDPAGAPESGYADFSAVESIALLGFGAEGEATALNVVRSGLNVTARAQAAASIAEQPGIGVSVGAFDAETNASVEGLNEFTLSSTGGSPFALAGLFLKIEGEPTTLTVSGLDNGLALEGAVYELGPDKWPSDAASLVYLDLRNIASFERIDAARFAFADPVATVHIVGVLTDYEPARPTLSIEAFLPENPVAIGSAMALDLRVEYCFQRWGPVEGFGYAPPLLVSEDAIVWVDLDERALTPSFEVTGEANGLESVRMTLILRAWGLGPRLFFKASPVGAP